MTRLADDMVLVPGDAREDEGPRERPRAHLPQEATGRPGLSPETLAEVEAWARQAAASNGFGDAATLSGPLRSPHEQQRRQERAMSSPQVLYDHCLGHSIRHAWTVDDCFRGRDFDFAKPFLPDRIAGVARIACLSETEKLTLNQIRGNSYCHIFAFVEELIRKL